MLLKKIFYGYSRVRYVICQQEENGKVSFEFCRWIPLGSRNGHYQYYHNVYIREANNDGRYITTRKSEHILTKLNRITSKRYVRFGYFGDWCVTFYSPQIKEIIFSWLLKNWMWFWLLYIIIAYYVK